MIYDHKNSDLRATVYDGDRHMDIRRVIQVDDQAGELTVVCDPLRIGEDGQFAVEVQRFAAIYPIFGGRPWPCLFLCYGAQ